MKKVSSKQLWNRYWSLEADLKELAQSLNVSVTYLRKNAEHFSPDVHEATYYNLIEQIEVLKKLQKDRISALIKNPVVKLDLYRRFA